MQDSSYFTHLRTDVLAMVPESARSFLSVGCGSGRTEAELVKRGATVVGIEIDHNASDEARANGLEMIEGDAVAIADALRERRFDCLIYADILEHLADPVAMVREHLHSLDPGGCVIVSIPNFRHIEVLRQLFVFGHIRYADSGILDRTHLRITTRKLVQEWFGELGLTCERVDYQLWRKRDRVWAGLSLGLLREFVSAQVVLRGVKAGGG